jgi:hypothetical protein
MSLDQPQQNKMMTAAPAKKQFHFAGDGFYRNMTIYADDIEAATAEWLAKRVSVLEPETPAEQSTPAPINEQEKSEVQ